MLTLANKKAPCGADKKSFSDFVCWFSWLRLVYLKPAHENHFDQKDFLFVTFLMGFPLLL
jgi:hypothetical protein